MNFPNLLQGMEHTHSKYTCLRLHSVLTLCQMLIINSLTPIINMEMTSESNNFVNETSLHFKIFNKTKLNHGHAQWKEIAVSFKEHTTNESPLLNSPCNDNNCRTNSTHELLQNQNKLNVNEPEFKNNFVRELVKSISLEIDRANKELFAWKKIHNGIRRKRAATAIADKLWDNGVIPYIIEPLFTNREKDLFKLSMEIWEESTCLVFKEKELEDKNYLIFTKSSCGCCSSVGKTGPGGQTFSIGNNCATLGIVLHELGHAIGFWHEHARPDRDKYVDILIDNIMTNKKKDFDVLSSNEVNSLNEPYDFESIMHYGEKTFANRSDTYTIIPRNQFGFGRPKINQTSRLSPGDIRQTNKLYKCPSCGSTLNKAFDRFEYVQKLGQPALCQWRITASYGERVQLNISSLAITYSKNCEQNYLEIRDGHSIKSPSLGRFCGSNVSSLFLSSGRRMWVEFKSNVQSDNFSADYVTVCGGDIRKDGDTINSPSYPHRYSAKSDCVWNINVQDRFIVVLKFEYFDLEHDDHCMNDFLDVIDGHGKSSELLGRYCGFKHPNEIRSTGNKMSLVFKSDSNIEKTGFLVSFVQEMDECTSDNHGCDHVCVNTIGSYKCQCNLGYDLLSNGKTCAKICGGYIHENKGNITSPLYPDQYPPNKVCSWTIIAPKGKKIILNFTHFDLEGIISTKCYFDFVTVNRQSEEDVFCGNVLPKPIVSKNNIMTIKFKSDKYVQKSGFVVFFFTEPL